MKMPKKAGILFVSMGAVLILSALLLFFYNGLEARRAGQEAELLLEDIQAAISEGPTMETLAEDETIPDELPVVWIDGYEYIGYLSFPDWELHLPVMAKWDYERLKLAPCRHFGSSLTDDLVIAAHNYDTHFGGLSKLEIGSKILFTDMEGNVNHYALQYVKTLDPDQVDAVQNSGYDLVLYTCTIGGSYRVVAFCDRVPEEA